MTPAQVAQLKLDEGCVLVAYDDGTGQQLRPGYRLAGHPTVGIGRALDVQGLTQAEADYLLNNDVLSVEAMSAQIDWIAALDPVRRGVIEQMFFNIGLGGTLKFVAMVAAIKAGDYEKAAAAMLASTWHNQVKSRAERLATQMRTGNDPKVSV